jgi:hypothetical protein
VTSKCPQFVHRPCLSVRDVPRGYDYPSFKAPSQSTLKLIPAYVWQSLPSGALTFVNERTANYLGLIKSPPLPFIIGTAHRVIRRSHFYIWTITKRQAEFISLVLARTGTAKWAYKFVMLKENPASSQEDLPIFATANSEWQKGKPGRSMWTPPIMVKVMRIGTLFQGLHPVR